MQMLWPKSMSLEITHDDDRPVVIGYQATPPAWTLCHGPDLDCSSITITVVTFVFIECILCASQIAVFLISMRMVSSSTIYI